jgi:uncharacterized protein (DUF1800 family)
MTEREKIAHLLRRFGFGASVQELESYATLGFDATLRRIVDYKPEPDSVHPFRWFQTKAGETEIGTYRLKMWWAYIMVTTRTPLREKMALFWHDHFAIHEDDAGDPLMVLEYLQVLRSDPLGLFPALLQKVPKSPAFMEMLTMRGSFKGAPNENFARELLELYTLGIGHYTEKDVQEAARAFTGWSYESLYYRSRWNDMERLKATSDSGMPLASYGFFESYFDAGSKTILGEAKAFKGEDVLAKTALHLKTAEHLTGKLWEYFAGTTPDPKVLATLASEYLKTKGDIRAVLMMIARHPGFYSQEVIRAKIKNPIEHHVGIVRAMDSVSWLPAKVGINKPWNEPIPREVQDQIGGLAYHFAQSGMNLLAAPTVAGWDWGEAWINSNSMLWRAKFEGIYTWEPKDKERKKWGPASGGDAFVSAIKAMGPQNVEGIALALQIFFDVKLDDQAKQALINHLNSHGGYEPCKSGNDGWFFGQLWEAFKLLKVAPAFHVH